MIHLCVHCRVRTAGFWVMAKGAKTVRRPWCLACLDHLDRDAVDITPIQERQ